MNDASCGPSNALQNFNKHASVDRTLQQDRLAARHASAQGFRSQTSQDGILDPEFAAFEANHGGPALPDLQHPAHHAMPVQSPMNTQSGPSWAMDFQNLHISNQGHPQMQGPPAIQRPGGWQDEFMMQHQRPQPSAAHAQPTHSQMNQPYRPSFAPSFPMYNGSASTFQNPQQAHSTTETFDEAAFEAAFEQVHADLEHQQTVNAQPEHLQSTTSHTDEQLVNADPEHLQSTSPPTEHLMPEVQPIESLETAHETIRIGSDTIPQSEEQHHQNSTHNADALAQTAGVLLDSVRHEQDDKFQQSTFLALMRRIRDREVEVNGDEFRETTQSLHPGGQYYPSQSPLQSSASVPDNTNEILRDLTQYNEPMIDDDSPRLGTNPYDSGDGNALYEGLDHKHGSVDCFQVFD